MQVIGVGFGRTGTKSLNVALEELGAGPCLHSLESLHAGGGPEILDAWPDAKVILRAGHAAREALSSVPADRLLIYDVRDGWEPLCAFLEVPVPEAPFPEVNGHGALRAPLVTTEQSSRPTETMASIAGLALAHPATSVTQDEVLDLLGLSEDAFAQRIFSRSGVHTRRLDLLPELGQTAMQGRTEAAEQRLLDYAIEAVQKLDVDPGEIGTVVTSSLYSLGCPTLDHRLVAHFSMNPDTDKYHVVGVGCASAVPLIRLAAGSLQGRPDRKGLIVAAETMSGLLSQASRDDERSKTVGSSIFGDGCGAMLIDIGADTSGPTVVASKVHHVSNTLDAVTMRFSPVDSYLHMVRELPDVAGQNLRPLVAEFLRDNGITSHMVDHWVIHPGGRRIIEAAQDALSLSDDDVRVSYEVLANHGNVGTPTIFYVLHQTIEERQPSPGEHGLVVTVGPGVTVGLMLLRW